MQRCMGAIRAAVLGAVVLSVPAAASMTVVADNNDGFLLVRTSCQPQGDALLDAARRPEASPLEASECNNRAAPVHKRVRRVARPPTAVSPGFETQQHSRSTG